MPKTFGTALSQAQISDILAYIESLKVIVRRMRMKKFFTSALIRGLLWQAIGWIVGALFVTGIRVLMGLNPFVTRPILLYGTGLGVWRVGGRPLVCGEYGCHDGLVQMGKGRGSSGTP